MNISERVAGSGVLRWMTGANLCSEIMPCKSPSAAMPSVCGVMSTRTGPTSMPLIRPPCTAAPMATHRSGSTSVCSSRPSRRSSRRWTSGVRLAPPTRITLSICWAFKRASSSD